MKQYSGWQAPFLSFWSASFYQEVGKAWAGLGYLYLFLLIATVALIFSLQLHIVYVPQIRQYIDTLIDKMPQITIENGKLSIDKPSPYTVTIPEDNSRSKDHPTTIIFDTRKNHIDPKHGEYGILVTSDTIFAQERLQTREYDLSKIDHFVLEKGSAEQFVDLILKWLAILLFVIYLPVTFLVCILQTLIYAGMGNALANHSGTKLGFGTLIRLSAVAMTPSIVLGMFIKVASINVPLWWLISIVITFGYLYFAVDANKTSNA